MKLTNHKQIPPGPPFSKGGTIKAEEVIAGPPFEKGRCGGIYQNGKPPSDSLHEECGVFGIYNHKEAARLAYLGIQQLQHRGQESAGIVSSDGKSFTPTCAWAWWRRRSDR